MRSFQIIHNLNQKESLSSAWLSKFAIFLIFSATFYQPFFCFINTNIFSINASFLMLTEALLLAIVLFNFLKKPPSLAMVSLLILVFANSFLLVVFQQYFDPKVVRNLMTPILIIWLGLSYNCKVSPDKLLKIISVIVITVAIVEFVLPQLYEFFFNVINYQISIGRSTEAATKYTSSTFSGNGTRWVGRILLPPLGDHRASSIFLETVSMGNFAVLLACWGLSKQTLKEALFFLIAALFVTVLADSRFASMLITVLVLLRVFVAPNLIKYLAYFMPVFILIVCMYLASPEFTDDFKGRLGSTGNFILNFKPSEFFGLYNRHYLMFVDQGYAYVMHFCGLTIALIMWISFCRLKTYTPESTLFKSFIAILIAANLAISGDSIFAFKWVALMWFLFGITLQKNKTIHIK